MNNFNKKWGINSRKYICVNPFFYDCHQLIFEKNINPHNLFKEKRYIQSAKLNGKAYKNVWIKDEDIVKGGALEYVMGSKPSKWGLKTKPVPYANGSVD